MKVGIVGSNGYLGRTLITALEGQNLEILPLGRSFLAGDSLPELDFVIDAGFPRDIYKKDVAVEYHKNLKFRLRYCQEFQIMYLYIGSLSSHSPMDSKYGIAKNQAEVSVLLHGGRILRTGLVVDTISPGGRYLELMNILKKLPFLILPDSRYFPIGITKLADFMDHARHLILSRDLVELEQTVVVEWTNLRDLAKGLIDKKSITLPSIITASICRLLPFLPLGRLDNLKSIAYKIIN